MVKDDGKTECEAEVDGGSLAASNKDGLDDGLKVGRLSTRQGCC